MLCGAVAAKMVLAYHGVHNSLQGLTSDMRVRKTRGIDRLEMGVWFLDNGFDVTLKACFRSMPGRFVALPPERVNREVLRWCRRDVDCPSWTRSMFRRVYPRFIERGGLFVSRPVTATDIRDALKRREPPIMSIAVGGLYRERSWNMGHYVVPVAIRGDDMVINDPHRKRGGRKRYPVEILMHACHAHSSAVLFISPRRR
jgi:hypothetical protein